MVEFMDPPTESRGARSQRWRDIVATLKEKQGEWGIVGNYSPGVATHIRRGKYRAFLPEGERLQEDAAVAYIKLHWEITTRKTDNGKRNDIYMRWLG